MTLSLEKKYLKIHTLDKLQGLSECKKFSYGFCGINSKKPKLFHLNQVHGCDIICAENYSHNKEKEAPIGDVLYSQEIKKIIGIKTADCVPILCFSSSANFVLAIHAGWRGLAQNIIEKTIFFISSKLNLKAENLTFLVGPCIGIKFFEIGFDVFDILKSSANKNLQSISLVYSKKINDSKVLFDLKSFTCLSLLNSGVLYKNIFTLDSCTFNPSNNWHSYRRDPNSSGRNWSWIQRL